jgi:hypothetical protein
MAGWPFRSFWADFRSASDIVSLPVGNRLSWAAYREALFKYRQAQGGWIHHPRGIRGGEAGNGSRCICVSIPNPRLENKDCLASGPDLQDKGGEHVLCASVSFSVVLKSPNWGTA